MTRAIVRWFLRLAPADFRAEVADDFLAVFEARSSEIDARGGGARFAWALGEVWGVVKLVVGLWLGRRKLEEGRGVGMTWDTLTQDVRYAARSLRRNPGFAGTAIAVIAIGIGANAAIFSAANAFFFQPLPFHEADELVVVYETNRVTRTGSG